MFHKKNQIGISSKDELRKGRNLKIIMFVAPVVLIVILIVLITTGSLSNLMGNSVTDYYCEDASYALEGNNCVKTIAKKSALLADVNSDDVIDSNDLNTLNKYVQDNNSVNLSEIQMIVADVNKDGMISETDVQILEGYFTKIAGTYTEYQEQIGVERLCTSGYTLSGVNCLKKESIPASRKESSQDNESSNTNINTNTNTNTNSTEINDNTGNNSIDSNTNTNNVNNPVIVTFKPEDNETNLKLNRKYKLYVNFDIKDTSKQYYYIWRNYLYGEENYNTGCVKVESGDHYGSFTMIGIRKSIVTVYNDSSCKNEVTKTESKTYTCDGCTNMVDISFKPQDDKTVANNGTKYKLNVVFDTKDKENTYYYIWDNWKNGKKIYSTECKKIVDGEHNGSFTMDGKRAVVVSYYSDSSCKNKIKSVTSKQYVCSNCEDSVDVELKPQDNNTSLTKGTKYKMNVKFTLNDKDKQYYYIWSNYSNGNNNYNTGCTKITEGEHNGSFTIDGSKKVSIAVYSDSKCKTKIKTVESKKYSCTNCVPVKVKIANNLPSSQTNGTVIHNSIRFEIIDKTNTYYYKWRTYNDGSLWVEGDCNKVTDNKEHVKDLTINTELQSRKGTITVYYDNKCNKRVETVPVASTTKYECSNCYIENYYSYDNNSNNSYNSYNDDILSNWVNNAINSVTSITRSGKKTSYSACGCYGASWTLKNGSCVKYNRVTTTEYYCKNGGGKLGDGPTASCTQSCSPGGSSCVWRGNTNGKCYLTKSKCINANRSIRVSSRERSAVSTDTKKTCPR